MAPMSSMIVAAVRKMRNSIGTLRPIMAIMATAKAVSVDIGTPQPCAQSPAGMSITYTEAGITIPPMAAATGSNARKRQVWRASRERGEFPP